jgi:hypothetical protein
LGGRRKPILFKKRKRNSHLDAVALKNVLISEEIEALEMTDPDIIFIENCLLRFLAYYEVSKINIIHLIRNAL